MNSPQNQIQPGSVLCYTAGEARLLRQAGIPAITAARLRRILYTLLAGGADNAPQVAADAIARCVVAVTDEVHTDKWTGIIKDFGKDATDPIFESIGALSVKATPLKDPADAQETGPYSPWECSGTTVFVAENTTELVRVADTYATSDCYRHKGRMDEPFSPQSGRVCLVTADELRLVRLNGVDDPEVVLVALTQNLSRLAVTPWPSPLRALCGEFPALRVGVTTCLLPSRLGHPFFLGLTRGSGYISKNRENVKAGAAVAYRADFDGEGEEPAETSEVRCQGRLDVHRLIRYGGMRIYTSGGGKRYKVQLRSLGLIRAGKLAGEFIYDLDANRPILEAWLATRTLERPPSDYRSVMIRRERRNLANGEKSPLPKNPAGASYVRSNHPTGIQVTPNAQRAEAHKLREMLIAEVSANGCVTPARLGSLSDGTTYRLNGQIAIKKGVAFFRRKRCRIRCPQWHPENASGMIVWIKTQRAVVAAGVTDEGMVFAVVKVANGTEDQQEEAVRRWAESVGRMFPAELGGASWWANSALDDAIVPIRALLYLNWRAGALPTEQYERYRPQPTQTWARRGTATLLERARAYADRVPLADEGTRNSNLSTAVFKMVEHFGKEATAEVLPEMLARSTLPEKEKRKTALRILHKPQGERVT